MIRVTRFDGQAVVLNAEQIQSIERTPDTLITLMNGAKVLVQNSVDEVMAAFLNYKKELALLNAKVNS